MPGFSHELISCDSEVLVKRGSNLDELYATPFEGEDVDTLLKALRRNVKNIPNSDFLGTRVDDHYEWMSFADVADLAAHFSHGLMALNLCPEIEAEGR